MRSVLRGFRSKKVAFTAGLALVVGLVFTGGGLAVRGASAATQDCDSNSIIYCGFSDPGNFITKVQGNSSGNGHNDLQNVYDAYGLTQADYANFAAHAVAGVANKDGTVVVNGQTVATATNSIGRNAANQGSGYFTKTINGVNYYGNVNSKAFASSSIPVYVLFDNQGTAKFMVLQACGNPMGGTIVQTSASCNSLTATSVSGQLNTYTFTASASTSGNASLKSCTYNFGDGTTKTVGVSGNNCAPYTYTYTKASSGNGFTASVTEYASVPGNSNLQLPTISMCTKQIVVILPYGICSTAGLVVDTLDQTKLEYKFTVVASYGGGEVFKGADFDFGDGKTQAGVQPESDGKTVSVTHTYAAASTSNIDVSTTLHFTVNGQPVTSPTCTATIPPNGPPTPTCKPGVPVGSPECIAPCQPGSSVPPTAAQCTPPNLPNTGAGNTIAIFAAVVIAGFLVYRQLLFRKHKAAFAAAQMGTSALPLGDPLNEDAPLTGTPLAPKRRSLRRKRPF
ncbi:MAG: hypothetical protein WDN27_04480 [Candidatus Saccharibacteria bacterium]